MTRHKRHRIKLRSMYQWHRYTGVTIALFVILLSVTGIMLNHTMQLELDKQYVKTDWLLDWYGITAPEQTNSYRAGQHWISQWQDRLLLEQHDLGSYPGKLLGMVHYQDMLVVALEGSVLLFTTQGELIETLRGAQGVPAGMWAIGLNSKYRVVVKSAHGTYIADKQLLQWHDSDDDSAHWSGPTTLPDDVYQHMLALYRGKGLSLERVVLDLHSGRLLGRGGIYFTDIVAVLLSFLAASGLWIWSMRIIRERQRQRQHTGHHGD